MSADVIECKRGAVRCHVADLTERYKTELNKSLEAVADTESKTVSVIKEIRDGICDTTVSEGSCNELTGTFRFVTCREAAGDHHDVCFTDLSSKFSE